MNKDDIADIIGKDLEELYLDVGIAIFAKMAIPPDNKNLIAAGRKWLKSKKSEFAELICKDDKILQIRNMQNSAKRRIQLVIAVCDLITGVITGVPPWTVSALIVKEGIHTLCDEVWKHELETN